jgi:hypothetical protein
MWRCRPTTSMGRTNSNAKHSVLRPASRTTVGGVSVSTATIRPSLPWRSVYARYPARSCRSANGHYPPNRPVHGRGLVCPLHVDCVEKVGKCAFSQSAHLLAECLSRRWLRARRAWEARTRRDCAFCRTPSEKFLKPAHVRLNCDRREKSSFSTSGNGTGALLRKPI